MRAAHIWPCSESGSAATRRSRTSASAGVRSKALPTAAARSAPPTPSVRTMRGTPASCTAITVTPAPTDTSTAPPSSARAGGSARSSASGVRSKPTTSNRAARAAASAASATERGRTATTTSWPSEELRPARTTGWQATIDSSARWPTSSWSWSFTASRTSAAGIGGRETTRTTECGLATVSRIRLPKRRSRRSCASAAVSAGASATSPWTTTPSGIGWTAVATTVPRSAPSTATARRARVPSSIPVITVSALALSPGTRR